MTNLTHSYSSVKQFENCARQYHQVRILKAFKSEATDATTYGTDVHLAMENFLMHGTPLPDKYRQFLPYATAVSRASGEMRCEEKLGIRADFSPCGFFDPDVWFRGVPDVMVIGDRTARVGDWKGLALDTRIPTPAGFTTMGDIQVGDTVFDSAGEPCTVVGKSEVKHLKCYKVTFSDTTTVICDEEHLWKLHNGDVVNVKDLMGKRGARQRKHPPRIAVAEPLALPDVDLPIHPYVLGLWIADGTTGTGQISKPDQFVWDKIQSFGYEVNMESGGGGACPTRTVKGLRSQLRAAGMLDTRKHIPAQYLRAGYRQRLDLLQGLMDGDGNANPARKQAVFTTVDKALSDQVCELLSTLGQRPLQSSVPAHGFGKAVVAYPVSFRPVGINPFSLPRKADRVDSAWAGVGSHTRYALSVEEIPSVPTQCIAVDSPDHTFLCTERMIPTHNTGKSSRYADPDQLELMAAMIMAHYPEVEEVRGVLVFLVAQDAVHRVYHRGQFGEIMSKWAGRAARIEAAREAGVWNPRKGPLCRFCPVHADVCEFKD